MKIFKQELFEKHHASIVGVIKRYRSVIGYAILCVGVAVALLISFGTQNEINKRVNERAERVTGVVCQNITRADEQMLANLTTKVDKELIKNLHLSKKQVEASVHRQLVLSAEQRKALRPSAPPEACSEAITKLAHDGKHASKKHFRKGSTQSGTAIISRSTTTTTVIRSSPPIVRLRSPARHVTGRRHSSPTASPSSPTPAPSPSIAPTPPAPPISSAPGNSGQACLKHPDVPGCAKKGV